MGYHMGYHLGAEEPKWDPETGTQNGGQFGGTQITPFRVRARNGLPQIWGGPNLDTQNPWF